MSRPPSAILSHHPDPRTHAPRAGPSLFLFKLADILCAQAAELAPGPPPIQQHDLQGLWNQFTRSRCGLPRESGAAEADRRSERQAWLPALRELPLEPLGIAPDAGEVL